MKPPILQTDWLNRVAFDPESTSPQSETFFFHTADPKRATALSVRLILASDGHNQYAEAQAMLTVDGEHKTASERWPISRVCIDPERAGVGIGDSNVQEGRSQGLVRGPDFSVSWQLQFKDDLAGYASLPSAWLYRRRGVSPKLSTAHPAARVTSGKVELWHGHSRHAAVQTFTATDWLAMQGHRWGNKPPQRYAWMLCNTFEESPRKAYFEGFAGPVQLGPWNKSKAFLGRLVLGEHVYPFDTWRALNKHQEAHFSPTEGAFELHGPTATLKGVLLAKQSDTVAYPVASGSHGFANRCADLQLTLTPHQGLPRLLHSRHAFYEVVQPG